MKGSLRLRLLAGTLLIVTAIWAALALSAWYETRHEANELFDAHLVQTGELLAAMVGDETDEIVEHLPSQRYARKVVFQIWSDDGLLLAHSISAPREPLSTLAEGFSDTPQWRVYSAWSADRQHLIQVGESFAARDAVSRELAAHLLLPLALALPLLALALVQLIRYSLVPLSRLATAIGNRSPDRLDPIPLEQSPRELHPILEQLNGLLARIGRSLEQERNFTADAAHELRTPLAAMRTHAQVARASREDAERDRALDNVIAATDRATHLIEQLLTLARLDASSVNLDLAPGKLRALAAQALAAASPAAIAKHIELELADGPDITARVEPALMSTLLRNLIDNAVRYSMPRGKVTLEVTAADGGGACIDVIDQGPGIPAAECRRVLDRFYRIEGNSETGSGLGLSIAARIAQLHGARLELLAGPGGKGLCARIAFPPQLIP